MNNNIFTNNTALYGPNIGSYAVNVKVKDSTQLKTTYDGIGSGLQEGLVIPLALYDHDNQIILLDNVSKIVVKPKNTTATKVLGTDSIKVINGVAIFNNLVLIGSPGSKNQDFLSVSNAINNEIMLKQYGWVPSANSFDINFRSCKPGEFRSDNECIECTEGSYSLSWNSER